MNTRLLQIVLTLWAGSLWTICLIVAPSLFSLLADRHVAGELAGHFFRVESWLGLTLGGGTLALLSRSDESVRNTPNFALTIVTVAGPVSSEVVLRLFMETAQAAKDTRMFGMLHGAAAFLFIFACLTALLLVWRVGATRPAK